MNQPNQTRLEPAMREPRYHPRVEVLTGNGDHVRYVPAAFAAALVHLGTARLAPTGGKIRAVLLVRSAATTAHRIGDAHGRANGVRFYRWMHLDESARRIVEHHPRCTYD